MQHLQVFVELAERELKNKLKVDLRNAVNDFNKQNTFDSEALCDHVLDRLSLKESDLNVSKQNVVNTPTVSSSGSSSASTTPKTQKQPKIVNPDAPKCQYIFRRGADSGKTCGEAKGKVATHPDDKGTPNMCCAEHKGKATAEDPSKKTTKTPKTTSSTRPINVPSTNTAADPKMLSQQQGSIDDLVKGLDVDNLEEL